MSQERSYQTINNSYDSKQHNKQYQSPMISQLMRKDKEIESLREEICQQNYIVDELNNQVQKLEQQLIDYQMKNEQLEYQSRQLEYQSREAQRIQIPIQQTSAKQILTIEQDEKIEVQVLDLNEFYKQQLLESLNREDELKTLLSDMCNSSIKFNEKIKENNEKMVNEAMKRVNELEEELFKKQEELYFFKDKCHLLVDLLAYNGEILLQYQQRFSQAKSMTKNGMKLLQDYSNIISQQIQQSDGLYKQLNQIGFKQIIQNLQHPSFNGQQEVNQLVILLNKVEGNSLIDKTKKLIKKNKQLDQQRLTLEKEKNEIIEEIDLYKKKTEDQDNVIKEFEQRYIDMENYIQETNNNDEQYNEELKQKNDLIEHYKRLLEEYKQIINNNNQQQMEQDQSLIDSLQFNIGLVEDLLKYILSLCQGYNKEEDDYFINSEKASYQNQMIKNKLFDQQHLMINTYVSKIENELSKLFQRDIQLVHDIASFVIGSITYIEQQLPENLIKNLLNEKSFLAIEEFYELSYQHLVNNEKLNKQQKQQYLNYYPYIIQLQGDVIEKQTMMLVKICRDKLYSNLIYDQIPSRFSRINQ